MSGTMAVILMFFWPAGLLGGDTIDRLISVLLIAAVIIMLTRILQGRRPV